MSGARQAGATSLGMQSENFGYSSVRLRRIKKLQFGVVNPNELVRVAVWPRNLDNDENDDDDDGGVSSSNSLFFFGYGHCQFTKKIINDTYEETIQCYTGPYCEWTENPRRCDTI